MFKLVVALALVAVCSAKVGYDNYLVKLEENKIFVATQDGREFQITTKHVPEVGGQQYIKLYVNGPDVEAKTVQIVDRKVGDVYQSDILHQVFTKYEGSVSDITSFRLLATIEKHVENQEVHPAVLYALLYLTYENVFYVNEYLFNADSTVGLTYLREGQIVPYNKHGHQYGHEYYQNDKYGRYYQNDKYGRFYQDEQVPFSRFGYYFGRRGHQNDVQGYNRYYGDYQQQYPHHYGGDYQQQYSHHYGGDYQQQYPHHYGGDYQQQYPHHYGGDHYTHRQTGYPHEYQHQQYTGPYDNEYRHYNYGSRYQHYPQQFWSRFGGDRTYDYDQHRTTYGTGVHDQQHTTPFLRYFQHHY